MENLARIIAESRFLVAFTGAGVSTESGIPDFRSPGGIWSKYRPVTYSEFLSSSRARHEYWRRYQEMYPPFCQVKPNPAHFALAELENMGLLKGLITQNIDGLHQAAGNSEDNVVELHGRIDITVCIDCGARLDTGLVIDRVNSGEAVPVCEKCQGLLKPATISFGQELPSDKLEKAISLSRQSDVFLAIGSSLTVHPAAAMPGLALDNGARLIIVNNTSTPYDDNAHLVINSIAGQTLSGVVSLLHRSN